jgi:hypothetical protein
MAHTSAASYRNTNTGTVNHTVTFASVLDHETLVVLFADRTGGAVINSIADGASGSWTQRSTYTAGTVLTRLYVREDAAAATNLVVTIVTNASQNSQMVGRRIATDVGGVRYPIYNNVATVAELAGTTAFNSNGCAISAGGSTVGAFNTNNTQTANPTAGTFDNIGPANGGGVRSWSTFRAHADASGSPYSHAAVLDTAASGAYHVISFIDSSSGGGGVGKRVLSSPVFSSRVIR